MKQTQFTDKDFDDIRPYRDSELKPILNKLTQHPILIKGFRIIQFRKWPQYTHNFLEWWIKFFLRIKFRPIHTVAEFQTKIIVKNVLDNVIKKSTTSFSCSGIDNLEHTIPYFYISNHRDITLDSAFANYFLEKNNMIVSEIAFGDNLLFNDIVSDLIRLNRSFTVKRNLPRRELITESLKLSHYIYNTLHNGRSIWIAQKEGRAKDGDDRTNPAIFKMLYFSQRKNKIPFKDFLHSINIVPIAISYEYDPCDRLKGWELFRKKKYGKYNKRKNEDLISIHAGMRLNKGGVHVCFCPQIKGTFKNERKIAEEVDAYIHKYYYLWPTNYIAYDLFKQANKYQNKYTLAQYEKFESRFENLHPEVKQIIIKSYAMPVINKETIEK